MLVSRGCSFSGMSFTDIKTACFGAQDLSYFTYSREAILSILEVNGIGAEDEIVLPSYLCSTVIEAILQFTKKLYFYKLDFNLNYNQAEILKLLSEKTKLIIFVDYFGVETQLTGVLSEKLKNNDVIVVKDSAHAFLSVASREFYKDYNYDYLITSVYKNLPLLAGSIGVGNFGQRADFVCLHVVLKRFAILVLKNIIFILGLQRVFVKNPCELYISNHSDVERSNGLNIARLYRTVLCKLDLDKVVAERKALTREFNDYFFGRATFRPLFTREKIEMNVLQDYPLYFDSQNERDRVLNILFDNSIDAYTWPTFHSINSNQELWSRVLILPISSRVLKVLQDV